MVNENRCECGRYKDKILKTCSTCTRERLFGTKSQTLCNCGNIMSEEQLFKVGVCGECQ